MALQVYFVTSLLLDTATVALVGVVKSVLHLHIITSSNQIKSNLFAIVKMHNKQFIKITFHLAGQTGDSFALMSAHKN